jgi:hypothetical protein
MLNQQITKSSSTNSIPKTAFGLCVAVLLAGSATPAVFAADTASNLATIQIFQKVKDNYASMITYSDEGNVVITMNGTNVIHFSTRLARANFYLIEWTRAGESTYPAASGKAQAVWSSGAGDFLQAEAGVQFEGTREIALIHGAIYSGRATVTVPRMFFERRWEDEPIDDLVFSVTRLADEKVGDFNCYVFTRGAMGATNTLWIGKQDFLIHQVQAIAQMESMPAVTFTETHASIVLNRKFSRTDFIPTFSLFQSADFE